MTARPAYLVVHKLARFGDEWYWDYTTDLGGVNPAGLYETREQAEAAILTLTRRAMRGATFDDLQLDEETDYRLAELLKQPDKLSPILRSSLPGFVSRMKPLPTNLHDVQLDRLIEQAGICLYHILETELDDSRRQVAQAALLLTPQRPNVGLQIYYEEEDEDAEHLQQEIAESDDPAVARLNRVTQLFGRRYANHLPL
ncbi:hypothetical protein [Deinococcus arenicola]|uniref:Uncharacterized protein n=1 Tax=Deinococcus arenicola TaxID=2994950 RepID=A0ABU4DP48_9DEIO|nr:hypothetical protein [Deinococcus sp. ZS9-10]MDV6374208.1 hypothetical protein [Deinococcus sp. ZS9-10]